MDRERQNEQNMSGRAADHDGRFGSVADADMALPASEPIEVLENRAVGMRFEGAPILFDRRQILIDREGDLVGMSGGRQRRRIAHDRRPAEIDRRVAICLYRLGLRQSLRHDLDHPAPRNEQTPAPLGRRRAAVP